jgi:hypothetical protein
MAPILSAIKVAARNASLASALFFEVSYQNNIYKNKAIFVTGHGGP